ncbi:MAG: hypothetical protein ABMB14_07385, partial [Myxococcota bacterium]
MRVIAAAVLALALAVGATAHAAPGTRGPFASRLWTADDGLPSTASFGVGQDARGFVWVATSEGVARLDGARVTRVTPAGGDLVLGPGAADRIVVRDPAIGFADVGPSDALRPLAVPVAPVASAQVDRRGRLWVTGADRVVVDGEGEFRDVTGPWGPEPRVIGAADDGAVFVEALGRLLRVTPDRATDLGPCTDALRAVERGDGSVVYIANRDRAANNQATVVALRDGVPRTVFDDPARGIDLARRGPDLFAVLDRAVVRLGADDRAEDLLGPSTCCGSALVDREGGLWISGELGLRHLPNPRTTSWVPDGGMIRIAPAPHGLWITTWGGIRHLGPADEYLEWPTRGMTACPDARGDAWMVGRTAIHRLREGAEPEPLPGVGARGAYLGCASGDRGRAWFASPFALAVADPASPIPHLVPGPTPVIPDATSGGAAAVLEIDGEVLYGTRDRLCHAPLDRVLTDADPGWSCVVLPPRAALQDLERAADGVAWAVVRGVGVVRSEAPWDTWTPIPASAAIRVGTLGFATASTRGGVWILAEGDVLRVEDRPDAPGG